MKDKKLDQSLKNEFKIIIDDEFKDNLKKKLLLEYEKKNKRRNIYRFSNLVAACFLLFFMIYISVRFSDFVPKSFQQSKKVSLQKQFEQNSQEYSQEPNIKKNINNKEDINNKTIKNVEPRSQNSTKDVKSAQNAPKAKSLEKFESSKKATSNVQPKKTKIPENKILKNEENKDDLKKSQVVSEKVEDSTITSEVARDNVAKKDIPKTFSQDTNSEVKDTEKKPNDDSKVIVEEKSVVDRNEHVSISVYTLKAQKIDISLDRINQCFEAAFLADANDEMVSFSVYFDDVTSCVYAKKNDILMSGDIDEKRITGKEKLIDSSIIESKIERFLDSLGIINYKLDTIQYDNGFITNISYYFNDIEIYDDKGYVRFDDYGNILEGIIFLRRFDTAEKIDIMNTNDASFSIKEKYGIDVDRSNLRLFYKSFGDVYEPVYIDISNDKIYFMDLQKLK